MRRKKKRARIGKRGEVLTRFSTDLRSGERSEVQMEMIEEERSLEGREEDEERKGDTEKSLLNQLTPSSNK